MFRRVSTEAAGWREALTSPEVVLPLAFRLVLAALCTAAGIVGSRYAGPAAVLLGTVLVVLVGSLVLLRIRTRL